MKHLSLSHSVIKDKKENNSASSPDELAFVAAAKAQGFEFVGRDLREDSILIKNNEKINTFYKM